MSGGKLCKKFFASTFSHAPGLLVGHSCLAKRKAANFGRRVKGNEAQNTFPVALLSNHFSLSFSRHIAFHKLYTGNKFY